MGADLSRSYSGIREWQNRQISFNAVLLKHGPLDGIMVKITGPEHGTHGRFPLQAQNVRDLHEYLDAFDAGNFKVSDDSMTFLVYQEDSGTVFFRMIGYGTSFMVLVSDKDTENLYDWLSEILQANPS